MMLAKFRALSDLGVEPGNRLRFDDCGALRELVVTAEALETGWFPDECAYLVSSDVVEVFA